MPSPIINGIYTKDFPDLGRALLASDIIIIAVAGDPITYRSTVSELTTSGIYTYFTDSGTSGIVSDKTAGTVTLADIATDFPIISANGIIRANIDILIGGTWYSSDVQPECTKDGSGNLLTALFTLGNTGITTIRGRIY